MDYYLGPAEYGEYQRYALMQEPMLIKSTVLWLLQEQSIEGDSTETIEQLYAQLRDVMSPEEIASRCEHLGVTSLSWEIKFNLSEAQMKELAYKSNIRQTGTLGFRSGGYALNVPLYSMADYLRVTDEDVQKLLRKGVTIDEAMQFERNYMDDYRDVESFMKYRICGGDKPPLLKDEIVELLKSNGIEFDPKSGKSGLYDKLREVMSLEEIASHCTNLGVTSQAFQKKFGINNDQVKYMAKKGYITITGSRPFRAWGKEYNAPLYSAFDYFRLTKADVQQWLLDNPRRTRSRNLQR